MQAPPLPHSQLLVFWAQLLVLLLVARSLGAGARRLGQPAVLGELAAGLLLGPSVFGLLAPGAHAWLFPPDPAQAALLGGVGWIGVFLLLVVVGLETDLELVRRMRGAATRVAAGGLLVPFAGGAAIGMLLPESFVGHAAGRHTFALFMATALCISALPVIAKILADLDLLRRSIGQTILAAAMVDDVVGWTLLGVIAGIAQSGTLTASNLLGGLGGVALFLVVVIVFGQRVVDALLRAARRRRAGVVGGLTLMTLIALALGAGAQALGSEGVFGAFVAGVLIGRSRFADSEVLGQLEAVVLAVFAPVYFASAGLRVDLSLLADPDVLGWSLAVLGVGCVSKFTGAYAGSVVAGLRRREGMALAVGLNARGAVEIVVATVGLSLGILNTGSYTAVVLLAMATSLMTPPLLRAVLRGLHASDEEETRLLRERQLGANVLLRAQRLLLPSHGGPNSRLAARIMHLVWPEGIPATVLSAGGDVRPEEMELVVGALRGRPVEYEHVPGSDALRSILDHASLGYGAIALGATDQKIAGRLVSPIVDGLLAASPLPVIMVRTGSEVDADAPLRFETVLVPAIGTRPGRAAQEVAFSIARQLGAEVILAHVLSMPVVQGRGYGQPWGAGGPPRRPGERDDRTAMAASVVEEARALAAELGVYAVPVIRTSTSVPEGLLDLARERGADLIVLAANVRQASGRPFLGHGVEYILEHSAVPVVVVTAPPG
jgi:Kef-type K+ transport system membrane component KefB